MPIWLKTFAKWAASWAVRHPVWAIILGATAALVARLLERNPKTKWVAYTLYAGMGGATLLGLYGSILYATAYWQTGKAAVSAIAVETFKKSYDPTGVGGLDRIWGAVNPWGDL